MEVAGLNSRISGLERLLGRNVQRFRGGLVFKARKFRVALNSGLESNKEKKKGYPESAAAALPHSPTFLWCRLGWSTYFCRGWSFEGLRLRVELLEFEAEG